MAVIKPETRDLAARIYADLLVRFSEVAGEDLKVAPGAEMLAKASFKLAETFMQVEEQLNDLHVPKKAFTLGSADIAEWSK
jgi:hypothetical protein